MDYFSIGNIAPFGHFDQDCLIGVYLNDDQQQDSDVMAHNEAVHQPEKYFTNPHFCFNLPLCIKGTGVQKRRWKTLAGLAVGETHNHGVINIDGQDRFSGDTDGFILLKRRWLLQHEGEIV